MHAGGRGFELWDDGDVPPNIFMEDPYLRIFADFISNFKDFRGHTHVELPRNQPSFHFKVTMMEDKITTTNVQNRNEENPTLKQKNLEVLFQFKKLPISSGKATS